jgi:hypothetical protein
MYEVTTQNQRMALVSTLAEAEAVVKMHKAATGTAASRATYEIRQAKHPSGREL